MEQTTRLSGDDIPVSARRRLDGMRFSAAFPALVSALAALGVYAVTLGGTFVFDDDILHFDPRYGDPSSWWRFWVDQYWPHGVDNLYRPLSCLTLAIQYKLHGDLAWPYHLVNWLLHAAVAAAGAELARRIISRGAAWIVGLLFAVHPVHVEVVAAIVGRLDLLSTLFLLIALLAFLRPMTASRIVAICILFLASAFSKEQGLTLPLLLLAMTPLRGKILASTSDNWEGDRQRLKTLGACLCLLLAAYVIYRESILRFWWPRSLIYWTFNPMVRSVGIDRWLMPVELLGRYVGLLVAPLHLSLDYGTLVIGPAVHYRQPWVYVGFGAVASLAALLWISLRRRWWLMLFLVVGFAVPYLLIGNVLTLIGAIFGERLMYLPSLFFLMIAAAFLIRVPGKLLAPIITVVFALGALQSVTYARLWNDPLRLYSVMLRHTTRSMVLYQLACEQSRLHGDSSGAQRTAHACIENLPNIWDSYVLCIDVDMKLQEYDDAVRYGDLGVTRFPNASELKRLRFKAIEARSALHATTQPTP